MQASFFSLSGDIQIGMVDKKGQLEVEVIRARGLTQKPGSKSTPGKGKIDNIWTESKNKKYTDYVETEDFLSSSFNITTFGWFAFNKECVNGYVLATNVHFLPPCSYLTACHLPRNDFQQLKIHSGRKFCGNISMYFRQVISLREALLM